MKQCSVFSELISQASYTVAHDDDDDDGEEQKGAEDERIKMGVFILLY